VPSWLWPLELAHHIPRESSDKLLFKRGYKYTPRYSSCDLPRAKAEVIFSPGQVIHNWFYVAAYLSYSPMPLTKSKAEAISSPREVIDNWF
jgi:hypothetical protein